MLAPVVLPVALVSRLCALGRSTSAGVALGKTMASSLLQSEGFARRRLDLLSINFYFEKFVKRNKSDRPP